MNYAKILARFSGSNDAITVNKLYIDLTGDLLLAIVLNRIFDLSARSPDVWFARSYKEWYDDVLLTESQMRRIIPKLKRFGVETKRKHSEAHDWAPVLHYRVDVEKLAAAVMEMDSHE